jgi:hypothetical protein
MLDTTQEIILGVDTNVYRYIFPDSFYEKFVRLSGGSFLLPMIDEILEMSRSLIRKIIQDE